VKRGICLIVFCIILFGTFSFADGVELYDNSEILLKVEAAIQGNINLFSNYENVKLRNKKIVPVYDFSEALTGYHVEVKFDQTQGYVIVDKNLSTIIQIGEDSLILSNENKIREGKRKKVSKYLFAGMQEYVAVYKDHDDKKGYYHLKSGEKIDDIKKYKIEQNIKSIPSILNDEVFSIEPDIGGYKEVTNYVQKISQYDLEDKMISTGCGPSVGATLMWYMASNDSDFASIKSAFSYSPLALAEALWQVDYMNCFIDGTFPSEFTMAIRRLCDNVSGVSILPNIEKETGDYYALTSDIRTAIDTYNVPVALYVLFWKPASEPEPSLRTMHWVTVYGHDYAAGDTYVKYTTWGSDYTDNFRYIYAHRTNVTTVYLKHKVN